MINRSQNLINQILTRSRTTNTSYIYGMKRELIANMDWAQNKGIELPKVSLEIHFENGDVIVHFEVTEPRECYIANVKEDGGPCYQDSCVEVFLQTTDGEYRNFEFNSLGKCLSAKGKDRFERKVLTHEEYALIERKASVQFGDYVHWTLEARIPASFGITSKGNAYKCGDKATTPHYLTLFPINTPKPDYHRPEFFKEF